MAAKNSNLLDIAIKQAEDLRQREELTRVKRQVESKLQDLGPADSLRSRVLSRVLNNEYEKAGDVIAEYISSQPEFPMFKERTEPIMQHCLSVINAVKVKRAASAAALSLSMSKQQDLLNKVMDHFEELRKALKQIEAIEKGLMLRDVRSTTIVLSSVSYSVAAIAIFAFMVEIQKGGLLPALIVVIDDFSSDVTNFLFSILGF